MSRRAVRSALLLVSALMLAWPCTGAHAQPGANPVPVAAASGAHEDPRASTLQAPEQRSTRYSAYSLPDRLWSLEAGALGSSIDDIYGIIGVARGFKHGFQLDLNLVHWGAGLFHTKVRWNFFERPHFALAADLGLSYAHGAWLWILDDFAQDLVSDLDLVGVPAVLSASAPVNRWLQFDLALEGRYTQVFGTLGEGTSFVAESEIGARQIAIRPGARLFVSDSTALELTCKLPVFNRVPINVEPGSESRYGKPRHGYAEVSFADSWNIELGVRSRIRTWLYATMRVQYGKVAKFVYGASLFPTFGLEFRL